MADGSERPAPDEAPPARLPPQATMGLLDYLTAHAMDEDYAFASRRRAEREQQRSRHAGPARRRVGLLGALVLGAFALLVVVAGSQASRSEATDAQTRNDLADQVVAQRERLELERTRVAELERETDRLNEAQLSGDGSAGGLQRRVETLGVLTGALAVRGPGLEVVADDAPDSDSERTRVLDSDLQRLANGFWAAGAEAISLNGQRLTNLSTIRIAGDAITVNARSLDAPYVLNVVGDPDTLPARFAETSSGRAWLDLQQQVGLRLSLTRRESLVLPASRGTLRFAESRQDEQQDEQQDPATTEREAPTP